MKPATRSSKPDHLGPEYGAQFSDPSVAMVYHLRPPYPDEVFDVLDRLIVDRPRAVLDIGTGTGEIARRLVDRVNRVDAVDPSRPMIERGRRMRGGDSPTLRWINAPAETAPLDPPFALITAGASLHWMEWSVVMPRFRGMLTPNGVLAIVNDRIDETPWQAPLQQVLDCYSTNRRYRPYDLVDELESRGLFRSLGRHTTTAVPFRQPVADYVASFHARNGFSRDRMAPEAAEEFDREAGGAVRSLSCDDQVTLRVSGEVIWGLPDPV